MQSFNNVVKGALAAAVLSCVFLVAAIPAIAGDAEDKLSKPIIDTPPSSRLHIFIQNEFSDKYLTPRGLLVENEGVSWQPLVILLANLYSADKGFLTDATLTPGIWNCVNSHKDGPENKNWNEVDPFIGLTLKFFKDFQLDTTYTAFVSQNGSFNTSTNLDVKLTYHDHFIEGFSLNPYVEYFDELTNKATFVLVPATSQKGFYFVLGIDPTYTFKTPWVPVTIDIPTYVSFVSNNFYQKFDGSGGGSGVGVFSTEFRVSAPLTFIPKSYGNWTVYTGVQYYYINNQGAIDGNAAYGAAAPSTSNDLYQFHAGLQLFF